MPSYPEQPSYIRIGSSWKTIEQVFVYQGGGWKRVNQAYTYASGSWKRFYAYDSIKPTITSFNLVDTVNGATYGVSKTSATFLLAFSEPIINWDNSMVVFINNPSSGWIISSISTTDNQNYSILISRINTSSGQVRLSAYPDGVQDSSGINSYDGGAYSSQSFIIDVTKPSVTEFASYSASTATTVTFNLGFSETVTGLSTSDFSISGTSTGWQVSSTSGSGSVTLTETSPGSSTSGTLILTLASNSVQDIYGNLGPASPAVSTTFNVERTPVEPTISSISSTDTTLHNRQIDFTINVPAGLTTINYVYAYLYDSSDSYTGTFLEIDVTDTSSAFSTTGLFNVGRNPGTKYYVRSRTKNTSGFFSNYSLRAEITTGSDKKPPVLAAPTVTAVEPTDPGYPGASAVRSLNYSFSTPSSYLTSEVASVKVFIYRTSDGAYISEAEYLIGAGWGSSPITGTFNGLSALTGYYIFARSYDIYGGTNSENDSSATSQTTVGNKIGSDIVTTYDWGPESNYNAQTGLFTVTGNAFSQTSTYSIPGVNTATAVGQITYRITRLDIGAYTGSSGTTIATSSRFFRVDFSGTDTSASTTGGTRSGNTNPWNITSGTTEQQDQMTITAVGYGNAGAGRIRVRGDGSIGTFSTSPDQRIYVRVYITGKQKTWTAFYTSRNWSY